MPKLQILFIVLACFLAAPSAAPLKALRGTLLELQGRVVAADSRNHEVTVLNSRTAEKVQVRLGRDAFEPGQNWKHFKSRPRVNMVATYNLDGTVQARRVQLF